MQRLKYKITNWPAYNKSLVSRGSVTLWLSDDVSEGWHGERAGGERGRPQVYGDAAIQFFLTIKYMYGLPYRAAQGFVDSLLKLASLDLKSPCYTQACRRSETLAVKPEPLSKASGHRDVVVDSTGLKVYGEALLHKSKKLNNRPYNCLFFCESDENRGAIFNHRFKIQIK